MNIKQKRTWWVDAALFTGILIAFFLDLTGVAIHQWLGVGLGALALYHLITHWSWVRAVSQRLFGKTSPQARLYYFFDAAIFAGLAGMIGTGLIISTWFNLPLANFSAWLTTHILVSVVTLVLVVVKLGLHWRWIASTTRKAFAGPKAVSGKPIPVAQPIGTKRMNRREFLEVIGISGTASLVAITVGTQGLKSGQNDQTITYAQTLTTNSVPSSTTSTASSASSASTSSACVVRCNRGCSYPGHCRRYTDSNGNNRCDLGECL